MLLLEYWLLPATIANNILCSSPSLGTCWLLVAAFSPPYVLLAGGGGASTRLFVAKAVASSYHTPPPPRQPPCTLLPLGGWCCQRPRPPALPIATCHQHLLVRVAPAAATAQPPAARSS